MGWADILGLGASAASGGILGFLGSGVAAVSKYLTAKQEQQFRKEEWQHEKDLIELQMQGKSAEWEHEERVVQQQGSWSALGKSMEMQKSAGESYRWVNAVKDLFRPVLTSGLYLLTALVFFELMQAMQGQDTAFQRIMSPQEIVELLKYIVYSLVFSACTAGTWWFADRAFAPPGMKNR